MIRMAGHLQKYALFMGRLLVYEGHNYAFKSTEYHQYSFPSQCLEVLEQRIACIQCIAKMRPTYSVKLSEKDRMPSLYIIGR